MRYKKMWASVLAILTIGACMSACDSTTNNSTSDKGANGDAGKPYEGQTLTVCSWGGAIQEAQRKTIFDPFEEATGCTIVETTDPDPAKIKAMVQSGTMEVDVWDVDCDFVPRGIEADLFEPLDFDVISKDGLIEDFITEYSVPCEVSTICIAWNTDAYSDDNHPTTWTEFFDSAAFPGSRTLYQNPMSMFEAVLMADGVAKDELYPLDVDRVFTYLDAHRDDILTFWDSGAQSVDLVTSGDCALGEIWGGRSISAKKDGQPINYQKEGAILTGDALVIGKGSSNVELANEFISFATQAQTVANYAIEYPGNAPCNIDAYDLMTEEQVEALASSPALVEEQVYVDVQWWYENYDSVYERFQEWKLS